MLYPFQCVQTACQARSFELRPVDLRDLPAFCPECGWRQKRVYCVPSIRTDRTVYREEYQMLPGYSDKDKVAELKRMDREAEEQWQPVYDELDHAVGATPVV